MNRRSFLRFAAVAPVIAAVPAFGKIEWVGQGIFPDDVEFLESRHFTIDDICKFMGVRRGEFRRKCFGPPVVGAKA